MLANFAVFYAVVAVFYFAVQFVRARLFRAEAEYTPPPTIDAYFIVRVLMQDGRWGLVMQHNSYYFRLPLLQRVCAETVDPASRASLVIDFTEDDGRPTRILVFTAPDELAVPMLMPKTDTLVLDAAMVVDLITKQRGEISMNTARIMHRAQEEVQKRTGKANFGWFVGL